MPTFDPDSGNLTVIIETPKGSRNKYKYDEKKRLFTLSKVLPAGASFPFGFGFVPSTRGQDGDPLDVLVLMDSPAFAGCLLECRLIGVIEAEQSEDGKKERNDRLIAVAAQSREHKDIESHLQRLRRAVELVLHRERNTALTRSGSRSRYYNRVLKNRNAARNSSAAFTVYLALHRPGMRASGEAENC
ncbi:MAG: inorganic diphosphatase [Anaerolineae bacterium]